MLGALLGVAKPARTALPVQVIEKTNDAQIIKSDPRIYLADCSHLDNYCLLDAAAYGQIAHQRCGT